MQKQQKGHERREGLHVHFFVDRFNDFPQYRPVPELAFDQFIIRAAVFQAPVPEQGPVGGKLQRAVAGNNSESFFCCRCPAVLHHVFMHVVVEGNANKKWGITIHHIRK